MDHLSAAQLEAGLQHVLGAPSDDGELQLIVRRPSIGAREVLTRAQLNPEAGLVGDSWLGRGSRKTADGSALVDVQITLMNARLARLVAATPQRMALAGDQLYVDLDLSIDNLPAGTRLHVGAAVLEVTEPPHLGCTKFVDRFGPEAMRFVNSSTGRRLRLRGMHARVVVAGAVRVGDRITKVRADAAEPSAAKLSAF